MGIKVTMDEKLIKQASALVGEADQVKLVEQALAEMIQNRKKSPLEGMLELAGKIRLRDDYDYKAMRASGHDDIDR